MDFLRKHWFDVGGVLSLPILLFLYMDHARLTPYQMVMWLSLVSLFWHQLEEYRIVGTFPGMMNTVMYKSDLPDRYPLNTNTAFCVNVLVGWGAYVAAALLAERAIWLGIATLLVSVGNVVAHTLLFNIKGKTLYNAGMATSWLFFVPCAVAFFYIIHHEGLVSWADYLIGIPLGVLLNVVGILKLIDWMKDRNTRFIFPERCLLPKDRRRNGELKVEN